MRTVCVVQARMTSTRLPGKVLMDLGGAPLLAQELRRLKRCKRFDAIVVATTTNESDDPVCALAKHEGTGVFRGSEQDVLSRYVGAAKEFRADIVVRVTSDCPLIDWNVCDQVVAALAGCDYASNVLERSYPRGLDCEAMTRKTLDRIDKLAVSAPAREHVTLFIYKEKPELFKTRSVKDAQDNSDLRWTVDTADDLALVRKLYEALGLAAKPLPYADILAYARTHPELAAQNAHVSQKPT